MFSRQEGNCNATASGEDDRKAKQWESILGLVTDCF
jgi:hypothetical protein